MVLKYWFIIFLPMCGLVLNVTNPLYQKYNKQVKRTVSKNIDFDYHSLDIQTLFTSDSNTEIYSVRFENQEAASLMISEVRACDLKGCTQGKSENELESEYFDLLVLADAHGLILEVKILNYFSDYGYEISSKRYLSKYKGQKLCDFGRSSTQVDGISGATISYQALIESLGLFCKVLEN